jgi:hypothetical protein
MTAADLDSFGFDPIVGNEFVNSDTFELHLVPMDDLTDIDLGSFDALINYCGSEVKDEIQNEAHKEEEEAEEDEDDHKVQDHYMKLLASDYRRAKRAKQDRDDRASIRRNFEVLSALSHRVQMDHSIDVVDDDDLCRPSDSFRCRDSNLRTLRKATKTLQELMDMSRQLKKERREMKTKLKNQKLKTNFARKSRSQVKSMNSTKKYVIPVPGNDFHRYMNSPRNQQYVANTMYSPYAQPGQVESAHSFYRNVPMRVDHSNAQNIVAPVVYSNVQVQSKPFVRTTNFHPTTPPDRRIIDRCSKPCHVISM